MNEHITASAIISFCSDWEDQAARFYETLAVKFPAQSAAFRAMAGECAKHKALVLRTYQETVSDILETGYAFSGLKPEVYLVPLEIPGGAVLEQAKQQAVKLETNAVAFYQEVAMRSKSLLATIPRAFQKVAAKRQDRLTQLENL